MTDQERITALEARIAQLEARLAMVEQRPAGPPLYGPIYPTVPAPITSPFPPLPWTITCRSDGLAAVGQVQN